MKKKVRFGNLKPGECFRLTEKGPIYMKDYDDCGQQILGKQLGKVTKWLDDDTKVYPAKIKISEVK